MIYDDDCLVMNATTAKGLNGEAVVVVGRGGHEQKAESSEGRNTEEDSR